VSDEVLRLSKATW